MEVKNPRPFHPLRYPVEMKTIETKSIHNPRNTCRPWVPVPIKKIEQ
jgi:hypothetical protein